MQTMRLIRELCTPYFGAPNAPDRKPVCDEELVTHVRTIFRAIVVDSASNEEASAKAMTSEVGVIAEKYDGPGLENCDIIVRDKAHGSRRILQRPDKADEYMTMVMDTLVQEKNSLSQIIEESGVNRKWYKECCELAETRAVTTTYSHLRARKHRFEAAMTPLSRFASNPEGAFLFVAKVEIE